jgi:hypothetical protein
MNLKAIIEETLVAPMRELASRPNLTVTQERNATDAAIDELRVADAYGRPLQIGPFVASLLLKRLDHLQMLADAHRRKSSDHEEMVSDLLKLLDKDDLDNARDMVKAEYDSIHGPRD